MSLTFPGLFSETVRSYGDCNAFAYVNERPLTYKQTDQHIRALIAMLEDRGVQPGDNVAILSTNMPNWVVVFFAVTFMKAIAVPILPDFSSNEIENILKHADVKILFVSEKLKNKIKHHNQFPCRHIIRIDDFSFYSGNKKTAEFQIQKKPSHNYTVNENDLASIIYTSGTTGKPKGVMLTHKNICSNAIAGGKVQTITNNDRFLSVLPLSHTYENTLGLILPMIYGASVYYLHEKPVASVLLPALKKVRPTMMLTVPMIIERIYRNKVKPALTKSSHLRLMHAITFLRKKMHQKAGKKLLETFGNELKFFGIGGAKLNREVEQFLINSGFPYAVGYGLTESSPLLAGVNPQTARLQSTGPAIEGVELKINQPDAISGIGEIWAKGPNIMQGYYKDKEETGKVLTRDGWLKTGDLGVFDEDRFLSIKGRSKNVIVNANGENVYPEEIESLINNFRHVVESMVLNEKGRLVALVYFNMEELEKKCQHYQEKLTSHIEERIQQLKDELLEYVNLRVSRFSRLKMIVAHPEPFQKTPTQKIKRFLYMENFCKLD